MKAYLDNDIVSAIAKDDHPSESAALDTLLEHADAGKLEIVTSALTRKEIERYKSPLGKSLQRVYLLIEKVQFIEDHTVYGFQNDPLAGGSFPQVSDDATASALRQMGIERTDAHHLMLAIRAGCDAFLTCDKTILNHYADIEARFKIKVMKPSELLLLVK